MMTAADQGDNEDRWVQDRIGETRLHRMLADPAFIDARLQGLTLTPGPPVDPSSRAIG